MSGSHPSGSGTPAPAQTHWWARASGAALAPIAAGL